MVKRFIVFIGALFIFTLLTSSTLMLSQAQTTPLAPFTPPPPQPSQSLQFPNLFVTWDANADEETSSDKQIDKPLILRGIKNGEEVLMTNDFDFPGLENNLAIKGYPRIPQGANFAITTKVEESNAKDIGIENVTIRPILSQDANGGIKSFGKRTALTPNIDRITGTTEYSLSNHESRRLCSYCYCKTKRFIYYRRL